MLIETKNLSEKVSGTSLQIKNIHPKFSEWLTEAEKRIFSIATGDRLGLIAPFIMRIGLAKTLYSANELGLDLENTKPFVFFCPDGTITFNQIRLQRGFTYGCVIKTDFQGLINPSSMPNGCGFSIYELKDDRKDDERIEYIEKKQNELGKDQIEQLGKGNHFAAVYNVVDPVTGEDTHKRYVVVHCSGHSGTQLLYHPSNWLKGESGFYEVQTPHGPVVLLEGYAKELYLEKYFVSDSINTQNRTELMNDIFGADSFKILEQINHQGLSLNGITHKLGAQIHEGLQPIAFNEVEGLIAVKTKRNLSQDVIDTWQPKINQDTKLYEPELANLNVTPHGGGYELRYPVDNFVLHLDGNGIRKFDLTLSIGQGKQTTLSAKSFRDIREFITFRRKLSIMKGVFQADLAEHIYDLQPNKQIYPLKSIPGGTH